MGIGFEILDLLIVSGTESNLTLRVDAARGSVDPFALEGETGVMPVA